MVIACPSCGAQFRFDPARLGGQARKATCPKCRGLFVIEPVAPPPPPPEPPARKPVVIEARPRPAAATPAPSPAPPSAAPPSPAARAAAPPSAAPPAPAPRSAAPASPAPRPISPAEALARGRSLDWKAVGVLSWRVRTQAGKVHDFSSLRGLRKEIESGRVSPADAISVDGKDWVVIGELASLDVHFVETWERLNLARGGSPTPPWQPPPPPAAAPPKPIEVDAAPPPPVAEAAAPAPRPPAPPPRSRWEGPMIFALVVLAFLSGNVTGVLFARAEQPPEPAADAVVLQPARAPLANPDPTLVVPSAIPVERIPAAGPRPEAAGSPRRTASARTEPASTVVRGREADALLEATKLAPPTVAPGEGQVGDEPPPLPSDLILVREVRPEDAERVLRAEGLK